MGSRRIALLLALILCAAFGPLGHAAAQVEAQAPEPVELEWPENGVFWRAEGLGEDDAELIIDHQMAERAAFVRVYTVDEEEVLTLFVNPGKKVRTGLPGGVYRIEVLVGEHWYGPEEAFGEEGWREFVEADGGSEGVEIKAGYSIEITIRDEWHWEEPDWRDF